MIDIKEIRKNLDFYRKKLSVRNNVVDLDKVILFDKENRELIQKKEALEQEKKLISKTKDTKNFEKSKILSKKIEDIISKQSSSQKNLNSLLSNIPNIPLDDVPVGKDDKSNNPTFCLQFFVSYSADGNQF